VKVNFPTARLGLQVKYGVRVAGKLQRVKCSVKLRDTNLQNTVQVWCSVLFISLSEYISDFAIIKMPTDAGVHPSIAPNVLIARSVLLHGFLAYR